VRVKIIGKKEIFKGTIINLSVDSVVLSEQKVAMECIQHPGGAAVVPLLQDDSVVLIKQYRYVIGATIWEIPAGRLESGENPQECALRELEEEVGYEATAIKKLTDCYSAPAYCTEVISIFLATGLLPSKQLLDADEIIEVVTMPLTEAVAMVERKEITDAKTVIGLLLAHNRSLHVDERCKSE
jgi:ADP-ribose pyrophosphatase